MCEVATIANVIVAATAVAVGTTQAVSAEQSREAQKELAKDNARLQRRQIKDALQDETEANAQKSFNLARQALAARSVAKASNLGDRSVRAIARAINFDLGQDKATIAKNQEIARRQAAARLTGIDITLASQKEQIGDTSGLRMGLEITGAVIGGAQILQNGLGLFGGAQTAGLSTNVGRTLTPTNVFSTGNELNRTSMLTDFSIA